MARPKKEESIVHADPVEVVDVCSPPQAAEMPKPTVKVAHMHAGLDLIATKNTIHSKDCDIYELPNALLAVSKKTKRRVVIPLANVRGYELL